MDEIDELILKRLKEGATQKQIANELGVTQVTISYRIKKMREKGIEIPKRRDEIDKQILKGLADGKTKTQIAKELEVTVAAISNRIKRMKERGVEILNTNVELDEIIYDLRTNGHTYSEISNTLKTKKGITIVAKRYKKVRAEYKEIAKGIINLVKTRHATIEQLQILAEYYGVDISKALDSLSLDQER